LDRPLFFIMKKDGRSARIANAVAQRLNFMFQEDDRKAQVSEAQKHLLLQDDVMNRLNGKHDALGSGTVARARNEGKIDVCIPHSYRFNPQRYVRVALNIPLRETDVEAAQRYRQRLHKMLLDPAETLRAALRLEAVGKDSIPALKEGLASPHALVRFASAEALTYLGNTAGVEALALLARQNPLMTNFGLVALAGLDEGICRTKLAELLRCDDVALRTAAFMALRLVAAHDPPERDGSPNRWLNGQLLGESFWLHQVAPQSAPLVTYALDKRPEIVLYGDSITLVTPTRLLIGQDFTLTAESGDDRCTVSRISKETGHQQKQSALRLDEVLRTLAELGGNYADAVELLRKLEERQGLSCPIHVATVPPDVQLEDLMAAGRQAASRP
jgi:hypothetical protein